MQKRRILFLHLGQAFGGIEVYMMNLASLLRDDAEIVALCSHPRLIEGFEARSVRVVRLPEWHGPLRGLRFLWAALMLPVVILRERIDTVHINGHWESLLLFPCRMLGRVAISTRHQTWDIPLAHWWHAPKRTLSALVYNTHARFANKVVCVSHAVAEEVRQHLPADKVVVIPNWIANQPPFVAPAAIQGKVRVLFIGRLVVFKGLQLLLEAMQGVCNVQLTVAGEGPMLNAYRTMAEGMDVDFIGFCRDVRPLYGNADIFVMPSIGLEGLPLVSLEAMGNGVPCLFSDLPVHREITADGQAARLFRSGEAADLREQLTQLIEDEEARRRIAGAGYAMVQEHYVAAVARRQYVEVFDLQLVPARQLSGVRA
jgi:glycosyltransferase involved in cell wall biosynthesis